MAYFYLSFFSMHGVKNIYRKNFKLTILDEIARENRILFLNIIYRNSFSLRQNKC